MRILIPVDGSEFSKAAVAFVASRRTLLTKENEIELINVQCPVPLRAARPRAGRSWRRTTRRMRRRS